jgi:NTE family protein
MKALVLSGGGVKSAHSVGMLQYIMGELHTHYDIYCGVSAGAINCAFLAQYPTGAEEEASHKLSDLWSTLNTKNIYKRWFPFGRLHGIWKPSLYDSSPLSDTIRNNIDLNKIRSSGKQIAVGTVSITSGKYTVFDQLSDYFIDAVIASASFPGFLTPVSFLGQLWGDGGIKEYSPLMKAIQLGAHNLDVVITSPQNRINHFLEKPNSADVLARSFDLSTDRITANDIEKTDFYNKMVTNGKPVHLNILRPDYNLVENILDFAPDKIKEMMEKGYAYAKRQYSVLQCNNCA